MSLLTTCHLIHDEASSFIQKTVRKVKDEPMRFIVDKGSASALVSNESPLIACFGIKVKGLLQPAYDNLLNLPIMPSNLPSSASPATIPNPISPYEKLAEPLSTSVLLKADVDVQYENVPDFIEHCKQTLSRTRHAPISSDRRFDIEIRLRDNVEDWNPHDMYEFIMAVHEMCGAAGVAVVLLGKSSTGESLRVRPTSLEGANRTWWQWQRSAYHMFFRGMGRPALKLMIVD